MINYKSSAKNFNKSRKRLPLGKDNNGNIIYPHDFVKVHTPHETTTAHCSQVYWNALDGAFISAHPAHILIESNLHKELSIYLKKIFSEDTTCVKISPEKYNEWKLEQAEKNHIVE